MKKNLIIASVIALTACFTSCSKTAQPGNGSPDAKAETGMLVVSVNPDNGSATKADGSQGTVGSESAVTSLQVFIFYGANNAALGQTENNLETDAYEVFTGTASSRAKTITTTVGQKYIYAVANAPRLTGVTSIDDLRARILFLGNNYLTETTVGSETRRGLVMTGAYGYTSGDTPINVQSTRKEVTAYTQGNDATMTSVPIGLYRLAARIELDNIQVDFRNTDLEGKTFVVSEIYLKNVPNGVHFSGQNADLLSGDDGYWTNKVTRESSPQDKSGLSVAPLIYEQRNGGGTTCSNTGSETAINSYFYAGPAEEELAEARAASQAMTQQVEEEGIVLLENAEGFHINENSKSPRLI